MDVHDNLHAVGNEPRRVAGDEGHHQEDGGPGVLGVLLLQLLVHGRRVDTTHATSLGLDTDVRVGVVGIDIGVVGAVSDGRVLVLENVASFLLLALLGNSQTLVSIPSRVTFFAPHPKPNCQFLSSKLHHSPFCSLRL